MSKMLAPLRIELSSAPHPAETTFLQFTRDDVEVGIVKLPAAGIAALSGLRHYRIVADRGTPVTAANIVLIGNWGDDPGVTVDAGSNDVRGVVRITPDVNAAGVLAWRLNFADPGWPAAPWALVIRQAGTGQPSWTSTAVNIDVTQSGAVAIGVTIAYTWLVIG